jgi:superoxide dismutase, Fe-Mn family
MTFKRPKLPYDLAALDPFVSEEQMDYHYNKHHEAYFKKLNSLVDGKPESEMDLKQLVIASQGAIFNNAAQAGSIEAFKKELSEKAAALFGSGWAWLAKDANGKLEIMPLSNADTPLKHGKTPILTLDVWEHAYYIDYRNERPRFIEKFWDVINWEFAEKNFTH